MKIPFDISKFKKGAKVVCRSMTFTPKDVLIDGDKIHARIFTWTCAHKGFHTFELTGRVWNDTISGLDLMIEE